MDGWIFYVFASSTPYTISLSSLTLRLNFDIFDSNELNCVIYLHTHKYIHP